MPAPLERNVLVALVGRNDPYGPRGIGPIITAAIGLKPEALHLLYQPKPYADNTEENLKALEEALKKNPDFRHLPIFSHPLDLPDLRDYESLTKTLPALLRTIATEYPGRTLYFLSGHPQVRVIIWLSLASYVVESGVPLEVDDPEEDEPVTPATCRRRLRVPDLQVITFFRRHAEERIRLEDARLKLNLDEEKATLGGEELKLRQRDGEARTFWVLALLAAYTRYGKDPVVSKRTIHELVYPGMEESNVPKAIQSINRIAGEELVKVVGPGKYQLSLERKQVGFQGDFLSTFKRKFGQTPSLEEFPRALL